MTSTRWKSLDGPVPRHVAMMVPIDIDGLVLLMHRSDKVRSAKNVWSFPTGLHDIGETLRHTIGREMLEEYGLTVQHYAHVATYENIAGDPTLDEQYHWVISLVVAMVCNVREAKNREPDKHDRMEFVPFTSLLNQRFYDEHKFQHSFDAWVRIPASRAALLRGVSDVYRKLIT